MRRLAWEESDQYDLGGEVWDSMTEPQVHRLIEIVGEVEDMTFEGARRLLVERWEANAVRASMQGLGTWRMWAYLVRIANRV